MSSQPTAPLPPPRAGPREETWKEKLSNYWVNDGPKAVLILFFVLGNVIVFGITAVHYRHSKVYGILGEGVTFARGLASAIRLNCALILFPVMRNFLTWLRGTFVNNYLPIDKNIVFHKWIGWLILLQGWGHTLAHYVNFYHLQHADLKKLNDAFRKDPGDPDTFKHNPTAGALGFLTAAGSTGHLLLIVCFIMYTAAMAKIRRPFFELFWYSHHLFILFYILLCLHGLGGVLEPPQFWKWVIGPALLYLIERLLRLYRGSKPCKILSVTHHPSKVVEIQWANQWTYKPGMYVFLHCPSIASHEWHPFTLTSCPEEDFTSVHIRMVGDWTTAIGKLTTPEALQSINELQKIGATELTLLKADGPYGTASDDVFKYSTVVLVGAGIGVTPFASILKNIRYQIRRGASMQLKKVHFFWICRDIESFEWFQGLLTRIEAEDQGGIVEINSYFTGHNRLKEQDIRALAYADDEAGRDILTGLEARTHYGRPNFEKILRDMAAEHKGEDIGVFFCGPPVLSKNLYKTCRHVTMEGAAKFHYHKENF